MTVNRIFNFLSFTLMVLMLGVTFVVFVMFFSTLLSPVGLGGFSALLSIGAMWHLGFSEWILAAAQRWSAEIVATIYNVFHPKNNISPNSFQHCEWIDGRFGYRTEF